LVEDASYFSLRIWNGLIYSIAKSSCQSSRCRERAAIYWRINY